MSKITEWTYAERQPQQALLDFFADQIAQEDAAHKFELLALSEPRDGVCYGAYRFTNKNTGEERVSALIVLLEEPLNETRVGFVMSTEYDGPRDHHCPRVIYALLTRFRHCEESAQAKAWRDRVEAWHRAGGD